MIAKFEIPNSFVLCGYVVLATLPASAQFHTITRDAPLDGARPTKEAYITEYKDKTTATALAETSDEIADFQIVLNNKKTSYAHPVTTFASHKSEENTVDKLPELTIPNLLAEIKRNNIKYPKIILAQAILETDWFRSSVCRNKHNLFGLTNPRTGNYYEFDHWTESVRAYYTKVQYRYYQKNKKIKSEVDYLIWLRDLPYATDRNYIPSLIKIIKQLSTY